ncbi:MAG: glycosyltransferase family 4 protein [Anaerolineae bacterium]|nr:glycosyltransferase family 4 protein [Anaerolineae bacterium]
MRRVVLFVDHAHGIGGAEGLLLLLMRSVDRRVWHPVLAANEGALADRAANGEVSVYYVPLGRLRRSPRALIAWLQGARRLVGIVRETGAAVVVGNTVRGSLYGSLGAALSGVPFVWYMHDFWLGEAQPRCLLPDRLGKVLLCAAARAVIANSSATAQHVKCRRKTTVVPNGIDVRHFAPQPAAGKAFREAHGIAQEAPLVGMVGRLRPWKGQDRFLRMLASVRDAMPDVRGLVVGGNVFGVQDGYAGRLGALTAELGLGDCATFAGQLEDPRAALAAMDVFVHPGDPEPFGLVNVEAMSMGVPVVAFAQGALPEIVVHGMTGLLVPPGNERGMAAAIVELLGSEGRRREMGAAARERAVAHFGIERVAAQVAAVLEAVVR